METAKRGCPNHGEAMEPKPAGAAYKCSGCKEMGFGSSYQCENTDCSYILHENCANAVSNAVHKFLPDSKFEFYEKPPGYPRYCDGCGKDVVGFMYHCISTSRDLHPCCLNLNERISDEEGHVTLELREKVPSKCVKCNRINIEKGIQGWSYVSSEGKYCYHVSCVKKLILEKWENGYFSQETNPTMAESSQVAEGTNGLEIDCSKWSSVKEVTENEKDHQNCFVGVQANSFSYFWKPYYCRCWPCGSPFFRLVY